MSLLSEDVKTVIACNTLNAKSVYTDELTTASIISDNIATNLLTLVDPLDTSKTGTLEENGNILEITSPEVKINGNVTVTGTLTVETGVYTGTITVNDVVPPHTHVMVFNHGLLQSYTYN